MTRVRRVSTAGALAVAFVATTVIALSAQTQVPARDVRKEPVGTGAIAGIVQEDGPSKRPMRRATIRISGDQLLTARQMFTRDDGTFIFEGLAAGQYNLSASKATYLTAEYGARRPGGSGVAIALGAGERVRDIALRLSRYGGISGVIYDQDGAPAPGISVEAMKYTMRTGRRTLSSVYGRPETTDDRGMYRLGGLQPGEYFVVAGPSPDRGASDVQRLRTTDIDRVLQLLSRPGSEIASFDFAEPHQSFAPVYFPGFTDLSSAQRITLALAEERTGIDIRLQLVPTARIDGTVTRSDGQPLSGLQIAASAVTEAQSMDLFSPGALGSATVDEHGRFWYPAVPPGRYFIAARSGAGPTSGVLWATADVSVNGSDQSVSLVMQPGMIVGGTARFEAQAVQPPKNAAGLRVALTSASLATGVSLGVPAATTTMSGGFSFLGVPPGQYRLSATPPSGTTGFFLRSATHDGVDLLDVPLTVTSGREIDDILITFTDRPSELSGTLQTPVGTPTADYFIIVFASDKSFWTPATRRSVMARPTSTGRYVIRNLPPGEYLVAAVTDVEQGDWFDTAFLERLVPAATRITLAEGERKQLDLRIQSLAS